MQESFQDPQTTPGKSATAVTPTIIASVVLLAVVASVWFLFEPPTARKRPPGPAVANLKMTAAEQEYVKNIQIGSVSLSRAENFLHQEVTILNGEVYNAGPASISSLRVTTTFSDEMNQIALRETRSILGSPEVPLAPGERRSFEISFDHVPNSWNMQQPTVIVAYLQFSPR